MYKQNAASDIAIMKTESQEGSLFQQTEFFPSVIATLSVTLSSFGIKTLPLVILKLKLVLVDLLLSKNCFMFYPYC